MVGDLINKRFKKLVVLNEFRRNKNTYCHCICDCGRELDVLKPNIKRKKQVSCGKCKSPILLYMEIVILFIVVVKQNGG